MKIRIRRRDGITQTYHVRMRALKKLAPEGLFTISYEYDEGQDLFRAKKPTAWGKQPMKMLKEYPELVTLTRESGIKNVVFKPDIRTLEDKRKKKGFIGRFIPKQNIIELSIAPGYDAWNKTATIESTDELAHTLLHEIQHKKDYDRRIKDWETAKLYHVLGTKNVREDRAEDAADRLHKELTEQKRTANKRTEESFQKIFS